MRVLFNITKGRSNIAEFLHRMLLFFKINPTDRASDTLFQKDSKDELILTDAAYNLFYGVLVLYDEISLYQ